MKLLQVHLPRLLMFYALQFVLFLVMDVIWGVQRPVTDVLGRAFFMGSVTYCAVSIAEARAEKAKTRAHSGEKNNAS